MVASFADFTGQKLLAEAEPDSLDVLPALLEHLRRGRDQMVEAAGTVIPAVADQFDTVACLPYPRSPDPLGSHLCLRRFDGPYPDLHINSRTEAIQNRHQAVRGKP